MTPTQRRARQAAARRSMANHRQREARLLARALRDMPPRGWGHRVWVVPQLGRLICVGHPGQRPYFPPSGAQP